MKEKKYDHLKGGELPFEDLADDGSSNDEPDKTLSDEDKEDIFKDLLSEDADTRTYALNILKEIITPGETIQFIRKLRPSEWQGKACCCALLAHFGDEQSVSKLKDLMLDFNQNVRREAEKALKKLGHKNPVSEDEVAELAMSLTYPSWWVREQAVKSLEALGDPRAIGPIGNLLNDEEETVRKAAEQALKVLKSKKSAADSREPID